MVVVGARRCIFCLSKKDVCSKIGMYEGPRRYLGLGPTGVMESASGVLETRWGCDMSTRSISFITSTVWKCINYLSCGTAIVVSTNQRIHHSRVKRHAENSSTAYSTVKALSQHFARLPLGV
jgi:hypothetical protein